MLPSLATDLNTEKLHALRKMKFLATSLFILMAIIFIVSGILEKTIPSFSFVKAFSEAAMVGALADWFAVVALFRHPFGIPIPHTAIIPKSKDNIGRSLADFMETHFLNEQAIREKISNSGPSHTAAEWLINNDNRNKITESIRSFIPEIFGILQNEEIKLFLINNLKNNLKNIKLSGLLKTILESLTKNNQHEKWIKTVISELRKIINKNKDVIREKVKEQTPWWTFGALDEKIYNKIISGINDFIEDFEYNSDNKFRKELNQKITKLITGLTDDEKLIAKVEDFKDKMIDNEVLTNNLALFIENLSNKLTEDINSKDSEILKLTDSAILKFAAGLKDNKSLQSKIDLHIEELAVNLISKNADKISSIITERIEKWDSKEISDVLEVQIGRDLQFIRINGTLVGGIVGLGIYVVGRMIS
ncbi:MAG: DUF445 domain-containing protein [Ignavibacteriae bacterium]|nr:DUF445 domain-containing protein [Ignavibacteriota bacterium]